MSMSDIADIEVDVDAHLWMWVRSEISRWDLYLLKNNIISHYKREQNKMSGLYSNNCRFFIFCKKGITVVCIPRAG
jgi:hypothetical protein